MMNAPPPHSENVIEILAEARNIRACIIISFLIQAFLTIFAPLRKCLGGKWGILFGFLIWLAYLLADWIAIFTIGSISLINLIRSSSKPNDIQVFWFWAPFLLLHLGGPDTITAFALHDNELWLRHLLGLIFQVGCTLYVFIVSLPHNNLWPPTLLVLIAGIIKYAERVYAFYLASFDHFGKNWERGENEDFYLPNENGTTSADQGQERTAGTDQKGRAAGFRIPVQFTNLGTSDRLRDMPKVLTIAEYSRGRYILQTESPPTEYNIRQYFASSDAESIVKAAVYLFGTIRRPLVGSFLSRAQLWKSFANLESQNKDSSAREALQKIEIELSLLYEVLHTKWPVVVSKFGFLCRALDIGCIMGALSLFSLFKMHSKLEEFDSWLTYGLLIGALALEFISLILLFVWSDWFFIAHFGGRGSESVKNFINRRRWSKTVSQLNFITYVVNDHQSWVKKCLPSWAKKCLSWVKRCFTLSSQNLNDTYWGFIFEQVESFSKISVRKKEEEEKEESSSERRPISIRHSVEWLTMIINILEEENIDGELILGNPSEDRVEDPLEDPERNIHRLEDLFKDTAQNGTKDNLRSITREYDFTRSLLIFHIATELFLQDDLPTPSSSSGSNDDYRGTCKIISHYLFYLAMMKSNMLAPMLDSWEKVFGDTYEEAKLVLKQDSTDENAQDSTEENAQDSTEKNACKKILSANIDLVHNGSVLILAQALAKALKRKIYPANRSDQHDHPCKMLVRVWVCLLAHAASNCRPNVHAKQPRKGGELLTFVWLCIANCGDIKRNRKMTRIQSAGL